MKLIHVVGARPNFMKVAPVYQALADYPDVKQLTVHTGQHYDANMSAVFFEQLGLPAPDVNLGVGSGNHGAQTGLVMIKFEEHVLANRPDCVVVYGDINSTAAAALVCAKLGIPVAHVEAGLRSFDRTMPEEINRVVTDHLSDLLFTPSLDGNENLKKEGIADEKVFHVGNVMVDTIVRLIPAARRYWPDLKRKLGLGEFGLVTLHRPSNVDVPDILFKILTTLAAISADLPLVFPVHPRTRARIASIGADSLSDSIQLTEPLGYMEFLVLQEEARVVFTDSGGVQGETTFLGTPCITIRDNTEWNVTVTQGTNTLVGLDMERLRDESRRIISRPPTAFGIPPLWDGEAGRRIAEILMQQVDLQAA